MSTNDNTPLQAKRFLPPSTASASKSPAFASTRRTPFQSSRPTQPPSSTPSYGTTPRFQKPSVRKDEIDTSFEDEAESPTVSRGHTVAQDRDLIDVADEPETESPLLPRNSALRPFAKKRKLSHHPPKIVETITISSSPEYGDEDEDRDEALSPASQSDLEESINTATPYLQTEQSVKTARFRPPVPGLAQPSLAPRAVFKVGSEEGQSAQLGSKSVLPDIFSPSRRKGKREYIPGGSAELVRRWVLGVSAQDSLSAGLPETSINVSQVQVDSSGRFGIVIDEAGSQWLLPDQPRKAGIGGDSDLNGLHPGSRVLLKGRATKWPLYSVSADAKDLTVAAYWEPIAPG
ncbi:hypothetical protein LTR47_005546 [Exophiala xenobiotica]|nr:hypothetical protein LTR47_005546 [Exophiala xenobiotica]KAK5249442.1 hypothetical protein LTS06_005668 [Exophiala xenobiotica]KAK5261450.1 hypothetical protein LTR40_002199 [Exophiala xenobiotica]KAK5349247.1 hypothetical protein LTR61_007285 [Exophiala xenobiotica]KAK5365274.1 hypothetical protein LTR11_008684 [Exophiala xenobiotica]